MFRPVLAAAAVLAGLTPIVALPAPAAAQTIRDRQWYLQTLDVAAAHEISTGAGVVVAVLDSGVGSHPDLDGQVIDGISYAPGTGTSRTDNDGHGSAMAGIIAANGGTDDHLLGIAPHAKILSVRTGTGSKSLGRTNIPDAIRWAVDHGATVLNLSEGGKLERGGEDAVRYALDHDVVIVAGSGNISAFAPGTGVIEPAAFPGVIAVSAVDRTGTVWDGAIGGPEVVLTAPGVDIPLICAEGGGRVAGYYPTSNGTSNATAVVSGAAALIRAKYPQLPARDVIQRLISTADDAGPPGRDPDYGYGRLNLIKALTAHVPPTAVNPLLPTAEATAADPDTGRSGSGLSSGAWTAVGVGCVVLVLASAGVAVVSRRRNT
ncbi:S8 family serine peptidase [Dactylosporangium sp. NPDC051485]|uniref:S8 family serine peptidase n=1 Tax=Dactylosporangium sp. NPDC051485 TaxID=3154846 RepID=UPI00343AF14D